MPRGTFGWRDFTVALRQEMIQRGLDEVTLAVAEILRRTGTLVPLRRLQRPGYWNLCRNGNSVEWRTFQNCGLDIDFNVEEEGTVRFITFRIIQPALA
jgi:hypothetical protein